MSKRTDSRIIYERYKGDEPYICLLFCESDRQRTVPLINRLQTRNCRLWYPEGNTREGKRRENFQKRLNGASLVLFFASNAAREDINVKNDLLYCNGKGMPVISYIADKGESNLAYGLPESVPEVTSEDELVRAEGFSMDLIGDRPGRSVSGIIKAAAWILAAALLVSGGAYGYYRQQKKKEHDRQTLTVLSLDVLPDNPAELEQYPMLQKIIIPASQGENAGPYLDRYTVILRGDGK